MIDQLMPNSIEAEDALLGSILRDDKCFDKSKKFITTTKMFYSDVHKRIYNIMNKLHHDSKSIDPVSVCSMITANDKKVYPVLDAYFITGLLDHGITSKHDSYAQIVAEKFYQRELIKESQEIQNFCFDNNKNIQI